MAGKPELELGLAGRRMMNGADLSVLVQRWKTWDAWGNDADVGHSGEAWRGKLLAVFGSTKEEEANAGGCQELVEEAGGNVDRSGGAALGVPFVGKPKYRGRNTAEHSASYLRAIPWYFSVDEVMETLAMSEETAARKLRASWGTRLSSAGGRCDEGEMRCEGERAGLRGRDDGQRRSGEACCWWTMSEVALIKSGCGMLLRDKWSAMVFFSVGIHLISREILCFTARLFIWWMISSVLVCLDRRWRHDATIAWLSQPRATCELQRMGATAWEPGGQRCPRPCGLAIQVV